MSIASGRAWLMAGQGLNNIGALLLQKTELQREHDRQDRLDQERGYDRAAAAAELADRSGINFQPGSAPAVSFTPPVFGSSLPQGSSDLGVAAPPTGWMGAPAAPPTPAPPRSSPWTLGNEAPATTAADVTRTFMAPPADTVTPMAPSTNAAPPPVNIGRMALGVPTPPSVIHGMGDTFRPAGFVRSGGSAADRAEIQASQVAGQVGAARARLEPGVADMSPTDQTLVGAGKIPETVINRATQTADERQASAEFRRMYPYDPKTRRGILPNLSDAETVRQGRDISNELNKMRAGGAGSGGGTGAGPAATRAALAAVSGQVDDTRADLTREQNRQYGPRSTVLAATPKADLPAATTRFVADSSAAAGRLAAVRTRADSLEGVRDRLAGQLPGMPQPAADVPVATRGPGLGASEDQARARAQELQRQGKTPPQIRATMRGEGYNVR